MHSKSSPPWARRRGGPGGAAAVATAAVNPTAALLRSPRASGQRGARPNLPYRRLNSLEHHHHSSSMNSAAASAAEASWLVFAPNNVYPPQAPVAMPSTAVEDDDLKLDGAAASASASASASSIGGDNLSGPLGTASDSKSDALVVPQQRQHRELEEPKPFRVVALEKLHAILPQLVHHLTQATYQSAVAGCALLEEASQDVAVATTTRAARTAVASNSSTDMPSPMAPTAAAASSPPFAHPQGVVPNNVNTSDNSSINNTRFGSPPSHSSTSPLLKWLRSSSSPLSRNATGDKHDAEAAAAAASSSLHGTGANGTPSSPSSNHHTPKKQKSNEWERLVQTPWTLLLVATTCAADMQHLDLQQRRQRQPLRQRQERSLPLKPQSQQSLSSLTSLYQRCRHDLMEAERSLCASSISTALLRHPHHLHHHDDDPGHAASSALFVTASSVQTTLQAVIKWISCQCQVLQQLYLLQDTTTTTAVTTTAAVPSNSAPPAATTRSSNGTTASTTTLDDVTAALRMVWHSLNNNNNANSIHPDEAAEEEAILTAKPLMRALQRQVKAILAGLEACWALEQALFLESIVSLRQWQSQLFDKDSCRDDDGDDDNANHQTRMNLWLQQSYQRIVSVLPLYFDRAHTMAGPMYGFDTAVATPRLCKGDNELNATVMEFLKRQERLGGPSTAVAIVLDAVGTSNLYPERGFRLTVLDAGSSSLPVEGSSSAGANTGGSGSVAGGATAEQEDPRILWPAIYLRSNMHSGAAMTTVTTASSSSTSNTPRNSSTSLNRYTGAGSPTASRRKAATTPPMSTNTAASTTTSPTASTTVLEYGPDAGRGVATTWPHSDWGALASLLLREQQQRQDEAQRASVRASLRGTAAAAASTSPGVRLSQRKQHTVTYRGTTNDDEENLGHLESQHNNNKGGGLSLFHGVPTAPPPPPPPSALGPTSPTQAVSSTTFHMVSLSEWTTMVVLVKKEEETRWRKKRSQLSDEDIQEFLSSIATKLRVANLFSLSNLPPSQLPKDDVAGGDEPVLCIPSGPDISWTDDREVKEFLEHVMGALGLRPVVPSLYDISPRRRSSLFGSKKGRQPGGPTGATASGGRPTSRGISREESNESRSSQAPMALSESAAALFLGPELCHLLC